MLDIVSPCRLGPRNKNFQNTQREESIPGQLQETGCLKKKSHVRHLMVGRWLTESDVGSGSSQ